MKGRYINDCVPFTGPLSGRAFFIHRQGSGAPAISPPPSAGAANFLDTIGIDIERREIQAHLVDLTQGPRPRIQGQGSGAPAISLPPSAALTSTWGHG
ncbi:MAG: hypothetical protein GY757_25165 [bacterium]|nr:hypothetical protein [bacterium]